MSLSCLRSPEASVHCGHAACLSPGSRRMSHTGNCSMQEAVLCDATLTQVLSWLGFPDLASCATLVCKQWHQASECKEVWRRRMHPGLLKLYAEAPGFSMIASDGERCSPARLFKAVYCCNLLRNGEFLERTNSTRARHSSSARSVTWVPTHNGKGLSWEYPMLDPSLPLPPASATHLPGDGSPSPSARRTSSSSAAIDIRPAPARGASACRGRSPCCSASRSASAACSFGSGDPRELPGSFSSSGSTAASSPPTRSSSGPFAVGCMAPTCWMWSELAQVVDISEALQQQAGLPADLAAAALTSGTMVEFSVWVASAPAGRGAKGGSSASGECQVIAGLVSPGDAALAAAVNLPLECVAKAAVPFGDQLPMGLEPSEAERVASEVAAANLQTLGLLNTKLQVRGPFVASPQWSQIKCRLKLPALTPGAAALGEAPKFVVALRGRSGMGTGIRAARVGPKFMAARVVFVPFDDE